MVQREFQKRWADPRRCKGVQGLRVRLPQWEVWGREMEVMQGRAIEEDSRICSVDHLIPEEFERALDDHLDLQTYAQRINFVKRRLGLEKHRALAQLTGSDAPVAMEIGNLSMRGSPEEDGG